jgi:allantoinase
VVEALAISVIATIAASVGTPIHIAHVTSEQALDAVRGARAQGAPITAETCPQYLTLNSGTVKTYGGIAKVGPPLRPPEHAVALWQGLADGTLGVVASDHSPFRLTDKTGMDFAHASMGLPTVELLVPVVLDAAVRGILTLAQAVNLLTASPARMFGLYPQKGAIEVGSDADLTIVSLAESFQPSPETLHSRAAELAVAFEALTPHAKVEATVVDGTIVYADSVLRGEPRGRFVAGSGAATSIAER